MVMGENCRILEEEDVVKFVIADEVDWKQAIKVYQIYWAQQHSCCKSKVVFSPAITMTPQGPDLRWATVLAEKLINPSFRIGPIQYSLQIHKVLWPYATERNER